jgi:hypothetical protein
MKRLAFCAIPLICFVACGHSHQPLSSTGTVSAATTAQPAAAPAPSAPKSHTKPLINPDLTGGVRGAQLVTFVVTANTKAAQGATVLVTGTDGPLKDQNVTNDWGEYHTSLAPGSYRVKVNWRDRTLSTTVRVDAGTQEIDLKLDTPPS